MRIDDIILAKTNTNLTSRHKYNKIYIKLIHRKSNYHVI